MGSSNLTAPALRLWDTSVPAQGTMGFAYVEELGASHLGEDIRFNIASQRPDAASGLKAPAILFAFRNENRILTGIERHLLDPDTGTVLSKDFIGDPSSGYLLTAPIAAPLDHPFGRVCIAKGIERSLEITRSTGCPCAAVWDVSLLRTANPPETIYDVCIDDRGVDRDLLASIRLALRGRAYLSSTVRERYPETKNQSLCRALK